MILQVVKRRTSSWLVKPFAIVLGLLMMTLSVLPTAPTALGRAGKLLRFNSSSGDYEFFDCRKGLKLTGRGAVTRKSGSTGCKIELKDVRSDRNISALANTCTKAGSATFQLFNPSATHDIADNDITNNTFACN